MRDAVHHIENKKRPVIAFEHPFYVLAKEIQWIFPDSFGEDQFVVMFGGLHIELTALMALGKWFNNSGWVSAISQSGLATAGQPILS